MDIEIITADSSNKGEVYRLLNIIHVMAGRCATAKVDGWALRASATYSDYVSTVWTNEIIDIKAVTIGSDHTYTLRACEKDEG